MKGKVGSCAWRWRVKLRHFTPSCSTRFQRTNAPFSRGWRWSWHVGRTNVAIESTHLIFKYSLFSFSFLSLSQKKLTINDNFTDSPELQIRAKPAVLEFIIITFWKWTTNESKHKFIKYLTWAVAIIKGTSSANNSKMVEIAAAPLIRSQAWVLGVPPLLPSSCFTCKNCQSPGEMSFLFFDFVFHPSRIHAIRFKAWRR